MTLHFVHKLKAIFERAPVKDGASSSLDLMGMLTANYHELLRLAEQIHAHAEKAPYPHVKRCLEKLAHEKRNSVNLLREEILKLGGEPTTPQLSLKSGKNHWQRINRDIEDQRVLVSQLLESSVRWAEEAPEVRDLLKRIAASEASHVETLLQLVMRADPQAEQN